MSRHRYTALLSLLPALLLLLLPAGAVGAPPSSGASLVWAFQGSAAGSPSLPAGAGSLSGHYFVEVATVENQTDLSPGEYMMVIHHVALTYFSASLTVRCPACLTWNVTMRTTEALTAYQNLTSSGTMRTGSGQISALALQDESAQLTTNMTEQSTRVVSAAGSATQVSSAYVSSALVASWMIGFAPALGFLPTNLSYDGAAQAEANFTLTGSYQGSYHFAREGGFNGTPALSSTGSPSGSLSPTAGSLSVVATPQHAENVSGVPLTWTGVRLQGGDFLAEDGTLIPASVSPTNSPLASWWSPPEMPAAGNLTTTNLGLAVGIQGAAGARASEQAFTAQMEVPVTGSAALGTSSPTVVDATLVSSPTDPSIAWNTLQGIEGTPSGTSSLSEVSPWYLWMSAVVVGVVAIALTAYSTRRRGGLVYLRLAAPATPATAPRPPMQGTLPEDPLEHLW